MEQSEFATKGLATVALLKANFDAGHDHIQMFLPFILDTAAQLGKDGFTIDDLRSSLLARHRLGIPHNTLQTLLGRATKGGFVRREAGLYLRTDRLRRSPDLVADRIAIEQRQLRFAEELRAFALARRVEFQDNEAALAHVMAFLDEFHVGLLLDEPLGVINPGDSGDLESSDSERAAVAAFLQVQLSGGDEPRAVVQELVEGYILQNVLFLKDISTAARKFRHLDVYLDTGLVLGLLGFRGDAMELATKELLSLLRETGARLSMFDATIGELRAILAVYESRLSSETGRQSLRPTDVTRYFLTKRYSPSDVRVAASLIERNLSGYAINIRALPTHDLRFTLDEADLSRRLADREGAESTPRVIHDVNCVAAVLTLRAGRYSDSLDDAIAVFATTSGMTVRTVSDWYKEENERGLPPIVHHLSLSNFAWLKRPGSAAHLKVHELVALCRAALLPSRKTWNVFLSHLRDLQRSGELSSEEVTAVVASGLTDVALTDLVVDEDPDAETLTEVIERVKTAYREEAGAAALLAEQRATQSEQTTLQIRMNVNRRARVLARTVCGPLEVILICALISGVALSLPGMRGDAPLGVIEWFVLGVLAVVGLMSLLWGFNLRGWRLSMQERLARRLEKWMSGID